MKADIQILLKAGPSESGNDSKYAVFAGIVNQVRVIGAVISYGINRIPIATVHIEPTAGINNSPDGLKAFCDFDNFRRQPVVLTINTVQGCIVFDGLIDGNSISQQPGSLTTSFIVKHKFTLLSEVYPRLMGANAGSTNIFSLSQNILIDSTFNPTINAQLSNPGYFAGTTQIFNLPISMDTLAIPLIVNLCKTLVQSQASFSKIVPNDIYQNGYNYSNFTAVMKAIGLNAQSLIPTVLSLLNQIDATSFASGFNVKGTDPIVGYQILNNIALLEDNLLNGLTRILEEYGCVMVIGNSTAYIVPHAPYLKTKFNTVLPPPQGATSSEPNLALPADYESFNFADVGENTVKGVYVVHEPMDMRTDLAAGTSGVINGFYTEDLNIDDPKLSAATGNSNTNGNNVFGNIVVKTLPNLAANYMAAAAFHETITFRNIIVNGINDTSNQSIYLISGPIEYESIKDGLQQNLKNESNLATNIQTYMDNWSQVEYCRIKYADRVGSINMPFNKKWVPGAPGSVYSRNPGIKIDFFVAEVSHNFSVSPGNTGNATTTVVFNGGRPSGSINNGLDRLELYNYDFSDTQNFCNAFLTNISSS